MYDRSRLNPSCAKRRFSLDTSVRSAPVTPVDARACLALPTAPRPLESSHSVASSTSEPRLFGSGSTAESAPSSETRVSTWGGSAEARRGKPESSATVSLTALASWCCFTLSGAAGDLGGGGAAARKTLC